VSWFPIVLSYPPSLLSPAFRWERTLVVVPSGSSVVLAAAAPDRYLLVIGVPSGVVVVQPTTADAAAIGFPIPSGPITQTYTYAEWGSILSDPWYATTAGAPISVTVLSGVFDPKG
jgi:hypothetical protein